MEKLREFLRSAFGFVRQTKESYDAGTRFLRLRIWIVGFLAIDVVATIAFVFVAGTRPLDVDVFFEPAFPSNFLVVQNKGAALDDVTLTLDNAYLLTVERIDPGPDGYPMNRFRDKNDLSPPDSYKPKELVLRSGSAVFKLPVGDKEAAN